MSLHPSLRHGGKKGFAKTVLKRIERIKDLLGKGLWNEESKIFGLPKTKIVRMKIAKKEKEKKLEPEEKKEIPQESNE